MPNYGFLLAMMIADYYNAAEEWGQAVYVNNKGPKGGLNITAVSLLGSDKPIEWEQEVNGIRITAPEEWPEAHHKIQKETTYS